MSGVIDVRAVKAIQGKHGDIFLLFARKRSFENSRYLTHSSRRVGRT